MSTMNRFAVALLALLALASCNTPPVSSASVASVSVKGPEGNTVRLGTPTPFTATATDENGQPVAAGRVQWVSSDERIATVNSEGIVTAKALGRFKISATLGGTLGGSDDQVVYGFQIACGTLRYGAGEAGTAFLLKVVGRDGKPPTTGSSVRIKGPADWKAGPQGYETSPGTQFEDFLLERPARAGTYTATATVGTDTFESTCAIKDTASTLPQAKVTIGTRSSARVDAAWDAVPGAASYQVQVKGTPFRDGNTVFSEPAKGGTPYLTATGASVYPSSSFDPQGDAVLVKAYSFDLSKTFYELPAQFNASLSVVNLGAPVAP